MKILKPVEGHPSRYHGQVGALHIHANLLSELEDGSPDPDGDTEWYVTGDARNDEYKNAIFEGYCESALEAEGAIHSQLQALAEAIGAL